MSGFKVPEHFFMTAIRMANRRPSLSSNQSRPLRLADLFIPAPLPRIDSRMARPPEISPDRPILFVEES
jgi:hypothetical protein